MRLGHHPATTGVPLAQLNSDKEQKYFLSNPNAKNIEMFVGGTGSASGTGQTRRSTCYQGVLEQCEGAGSCSSLFCCIFKQLHPNMKEVQCTDMNSAKEKMKSPGVLVSLPSPWKCLQHLGQNI